jgi:D-alanyl-D-alanine dipeptidase
MKLTTSNLHGKTLQLAFLALLLSACQSGPPQESGHFRNPDLVELTRLDATIRLDIRYATGSNFMHRPMYSQARAFLQRPAAEALVQAQLEFREMGYGVVVFDAYRPWSVSKAFWDHVTPAQRQQGFVADPRKGSKHNRGCAVDVSLYDLATGKSVEMPSDFDDFSERALPTYEGGTRQERQHRDTLRSVMEKHGFQVNSVEWWHFDYLDWQQYSILDVDFASLN